MSLGYLNIKSGYTFLKSTLKIKDIIKIGKENNLPFLALTDFNNMFGTMEFVKECKKNNIKGIIGMEVCLDISEIKLVLIASGNEGYKSLCKLTSFISNVSLDRFTTLDNLEQCKEGLICILPSIRSKFYEYDYQKRDQIISKLKSIFTSFYLGLEVYNDSDIDAIDDIRSYARKSLIPTLPIQEVLTQSYDTIYLLDILQAIEKQESIEHIDKKNHLNQYVLTESKVKSLFTEDEINNANKIGDLVEYNLDEIKGDLVNYPLKDGVDKFEYLRALAIKGLEKRLSNKVTQNYYDRLEYELNIINKMNYVNYFLVVYDYIKYAKKNDIFVGPGRGSSGGSLVSYSIGITNIDPIKYNLIFERFLNPERTSMPDIDADFIDSKRDLVIDYLVNKYGKDKIARVISFQTFKTKSALKDVTKAMGGSLAEANEISKAAGDNDDLSLEELVKANPNFLSLIKTNDRYKKIYDTSLFIEGLPRQTSMHAAGVVCNNTSLCDVVPVCDNDFGLILTQYDVDYIEGCHLYKMDLLSLTNLSIIDYCIKKIKEDKNIDLDIMNIDYDDANIYQLFRKGLYGGIFQMDKNSIRNAAKKLKPDCFMDIVVALALGRPGPMEFIPRYVSRKEGLEKTIYPIKELEPILKETYGIIVYQEQILKILVLMAGFSLGKADLVRRAISDKDPAKLQAQKLDFINGCIKNGYKKEDGEQVFDTIAKFAGYGFVKAHSVAYSMIAVQMGYLKTYYPQYFYCSLFNISEESNKLDNLFHELKIMNIKVLSPSVNKSDYIFKNENNDIRYSLSKIKGINSAISQLIIKEREKGLYSSFIDFIRRLVPYGLNKDQTAILIKAGCFDEFNINRTTLLNNLDITMMYASIVGKIEDGNLVINNLVSEPNIIDYPDNINENINNEKEVLGLYLSTHPLEQYRERLINNGFMSINDINQEGLRVKTAVKVNGVKTITTKNKDRMAILDCEDETGTISIVAFPEIYEQYRDLFVKDSYLLVLGKSEKRNGEINVISSKFKKYELGVE